MWPLCTANPIWWLLLPLLIGLFTGWWAWALRPRAVAETGYRPATPPAPMPVVAPKPAPVAAPVIVPVAAPVAPPVAPVAFVAPAPVPAPAPKAVVAPAVSAAVPIAAVALTALGIPAAVGAPDDLLQLKGVGPKLNTLLNSLGVHRFDQVAAWGASEIAKVDGHLGSFKGRITRDNWVEQAGFLATGNIAAFEAKYGKLDSENQ